MERSPKYIFDKQNWKPKLASDGRPTNTDLFTALDAAIKTWRKDSINEKLGFWKSVTAFFDILNVTEKEDTAQFNAWVNSRTKEELEEREKRILEMIGDRIR